MVQTSAQNIRSMASQLNREVNLFIFFFTVSPVEVVDQSICSN